MFLVIILVLILSLLPAIFWLLVYRWQDKEDKEPWYLIRRIWLGGMILALFMLILYDFISDPQEILSFGSWQALSLIWITIAILVILEEGFKFILLRILTWQRKEFNQVIDGVQYGVALSLGFAAVENVVYFSPLVIIGFSDLSNSSNLVLLSFIFIGRALSSTLLHSLTGGIMGLGLGKARFSAQPRSYLIMLYGFGLAVLTHLAFNFFTYLNNAFGSILLVIAVSWYFFYHLRQRENLQIRRWRN